MAVLANLKMKKTLIIPHFLEAYCKQKLRVGFSGGADSSMRRKELMKRLNLPEHMSANALLQALNLLYDLQELRSLLEVMDGE